MIHHKVLVVLFKHMEFIFTPFTLFIFTIFGLILYCTSFIKNRILYFAFIFLSVAILFINTGVLSSWLYFRLAHQYPVVLHPDHQIQWVVVLGGGHHLKVLNVPANQTLNSATIRRFLEGIRLYNALPNAQLIFSGGHFLATKVDDTDAQQMNNLAKLLDIASKSFILEPFSYNTAEEAREIKKWVKNAPFYLVTSAVHMPRSMAIFKKIGLTPIAAPADYPYEWNELSWSELLRIKPGNWQIMDSVLHEYLGMLVI